ncbi:hypothetical protein SLEP1_g27564 [Rubroshorea leprosula]|uniref:Uncharacterized protein n=1 Tax=Rubroshorea leprosula TaxID=152421 RepID=A0AAV5JQQ8_9ROSI|nr:hypothetical protein SLEP1_g27564 [Rubroshorea leprosula]
MVIHLFPSCALVASPYPSTNNIYNLPSVLKVQETKIFHPWIWLFSIYMNNAMTP